MKSSIFVLLLFPVSLIAQDLKLTTCAGVNYNLWESNSRYFNSRINSQSSAAEKFLGKTGYQIGIGVEKQLSDKIFSGFYLNYSKRSAFVENGIEVRNSQSVLQDFVHVSFKSHNLEPMILGGYTFFGFLSLGTGISFPLTVTTKMKSKNNILSRNNNTYHSGNSLGINIPVFIRTQFGERFFLQFSFQEGLTNKYFGIGKEKDRLLILKLGATLTTIR